MSADRALIATGPVPRPPGCGRVPFFSIITPSFNQAPFLERTIRSVVRQEFRDWEYVIIDGGSTDGSVDIIRRYERHLSGWVSEADSGMYHAVNKGLRLVRGEILAYLNSDDLYFPWTLKVAADHFRDHPDTDVLFGDLLSWSFNDSSVTCQFYPRYSLPFLCRKGSLGQPAVFLRRRVLERVGGFDDSYLYGGDKEMWLRAGSAGFRFRHCREFLAMETLHGVTKRATGAGPMLEEQERMSQTYGKIGCVSTAGWRRAADRAGLVLLRRVRLVGILAAKLPGCPKNIGYARLFRSPALKRVHSGHIIRTVLGDSKDRTEVSLDIDMLWGNTGSSENTSLPRAPKSADVDNPGRNPVEIRARERRGKGIGPAA